MPYGRLIGAVGTKMLIHEPHLYRQHPIIALIWQSPYFILCAYTRMLGTRRASGPLAQFSLIFWMNPHLSSPIRADTPTRRHAPRELGGPSNCWREWIPTSATLSKSALLPG